MVAMLAKEYRVPVVVAVETYKFTDGTRLDALGSNEVDLNWMDGENGVMEGEEKEKDDVNLTKLSLCYDLTAAEYITVLCTEVSHSWLLCGELQAENVQVGFIPPSSVPTVTGKTSAVL